MISLFNRLKRKKGFTIIEIIVVLGIMAVLLAMIVPVLFTSDKPARGNAMAKDFFYKAQDVMSIAKIAYPDGLGSTPSEKVFYTLINETGAVTETGLYSSGTFTAFDKAAYEGKDKPTDEERTLHRFNECCDNYFVDTDGMDGIVLVKVDENFAVQGCYWLGMSTDQFASSVKTFSDDNVMGGFYCGAFPGNLVDKGKTLLS